MNYIFKQGCVINITHMHHQYHPCFAPGRHSFINVMDRINGEFALVFMDWLGIQIVDTLQMYNVKTHKYVNIERVEYPEISRICGKYLCINTGREILLDKDLNIVFNAPNCSRIHHVIGDDVYYNSQANIVHINLSTGAEKIVIERPSSSQQIYEAHSVFADVLKNEPAWSIVARGRNFLMVSLIMDRIKLIDFEGNLIDQKQIQHPYILPNSCPYVPGKEFYHWYNDGWHMIKRDGVLKLLDEVIVVENGSKCNLVKMDESIIEADMAFIRTGDYLCMFDKRGNLWVDKNYYGKYASTHLIHEACKVKYGAIVSDKYILTRYGYVGPLQATAWANSSGHYACDNEFIYRICDY